MSSETIIQMMTFAWIQYLNFDLLKCLAALNANKKQPLKEYLAGAVINAPIKIASISYTPQPVPYLKRHAHPL